jgi:hypothetical protein
MYTVVFDWRSTVRKHNGSFLCKFRGRAKYSSMKKYSVRHPHRNY